MKRLKVFYLYSMHTIDCLLIVCSLSTQIVLRAFSDVFMTVTTQEHKAMYFALVIKIKSSSWNGKNSCFDLQSQLQANIVKFQYYKHQYHKFLSYLEKFLFKVPSLFVLSCVPTNKYLVITSTMYISSISSVPVTPWDNKVSLYTISIWNLNFKNNLNQYCLYLRMVYIMKILVMVWVKEWNLKLYL